MTIITQLDRFCLSHILFIIHISVCFRRHPRDLLKCRGESALGGESQGYGYVQDREIREPQHVLGEEEDKSNRTAHSDYSVFYLKSYNNQDEGHV